MAPVTEKIIYCKHGMIGAHCSYCNPVKWVKPDTDPELTTAKLNYELARNRCKNHGELWEEGDYEVLYLQMCSVHGRQDKRFRKVALETAVLLNRTYQSIVWHYRYMFENLHDECRPEYRYKQLVEGEAAFTPEQRKEMYKQEKDYGEAE